MDDPCIDDGLYQAEAPYACAGFVVERGRVVKAAPILGWLKGKEFVKVRWQGRWRCQRISSRASLYIDASYEPRACDRCGCSYRGPAVYCSLECAMADA